MIASAMIVVMLVFVPIQISKITAFFEEETTVDVVAKKLDRLDADLRVRLDMAAGQPAHSYSATEIVERVSERNDVDVLLHMCSKLNVDGRRNPAASLVAALTGIDEALRNRRKPNLASAATHSPGMVGVMSRAVRSGHQPRGSKEGKAAQHIRSAASNSTVASL